MDKFDPGNKRPEEEHYCQYHIKLNRLYDAGQTAFIGMTIIILFYSLADYSKLAHGWSELVAFIGKVIVPVIFFLATGHKFFLWHQTPSDEEEIKTVNRRNLEGAGSASSSGDPLHPLHLGERAMPKIPSHTAEPQSVQSVDDDLVRYAQRELSEPGAGEQLRQQRRKEFDRVWGIQPETRSNKDV